MSETQEKDKPPEFDLDSRYCFELIPDPIDDRLVSIAARRVVFGFRGAIGLK